jgi:hypothetical protein
MARVIWEVDDGYAGKSRPHILYIDDEDLEDLTADERDVYIYEAVQDDFESKVTWYIKGIEYD